MKILILNWRDIKNPSSGGAEILTHEIAKRWVKKGHAVYMFSSQFAGAKSEEEIDGVRIYRERFVHLRGPRFYQSRFSGKIDIVIDEVHGIPFFTPFYIKEKKVALVCEVAQDIWDHTFPFPLNSIGKIVERLYLLLYRNLRFMAISQSTKRDLEAFGVSPKKITVLPMGITRVKIGEVQKEQNPTLIFVGRLSKAKGIEDAIKAFIIISQKIKNAGLWVVGRGNAQYVEKLKLLAKKHEVFNKIVFWGYVSEKKKFELMAKAKLLIASSQREGFGLIVPEAGSVGTPAVAYDVAGLRDLVNDGKNGVKTKINTAAELAKEIISLLQDEITYQKLAKEAKKASLVYNWDKTAETAMKVLKSII